MVKSRTGPCLYLLAGFEVQVDGRTLALKPSSQRLLAFLALAGRAMERAYTAFRLWPDRTEPRALANLRSTVWRVRQEAAPLLESTATHIRLDRSVWVDTRDGAIDLAGDPGACLPVEDVQALVTAELLPDWYDDWVVVERQRLRQLHLHQIEACCRQMIEQGRCGDAIDLGLRSIGIEPLRESAHRLVIEAHLAEGNIYEALRQYRACRRILATELGVEPSASLRSLITERPCMRATARPQ